MCQKKSLNSDTLCLVKLIGNQCDQGYKSDQVDHVNQGDQVNQGELRPQIGVAVGGWGSRVPNKYMEFCPKNCSFPQKNKMLQTA